MTPTLTQIGFVLPGGGEIHSQCAAAPRVGDHVHFDPEGVFVVVRVEWRLRYKRYAEARDGGLLVAVILELAP